MEAMWEPRVEFVDLLIADFQFFLGSQPTIASRVPLSLTLQSSHGEVSKETGHASPQSHARPGLSSAKGPRICLLVLIKT
jgi:hypothetical protein